MVRNWGRWRIEIKCVWKLIEIGSADAIDCKNISPISLLPSLMVSFITKMCEKQLSQIVLHIYYIQTFRRINICMFCIWYVERLQVLFRGLFHESQNLFLGLVIEKPHIFFLPLSIAQIKVKISTDLVGDSSIFVKLLRWICWLLLFSTLILTYYLLWLFIGVLRAMSYRQLKLFRFRLAFLMRRDSIPCLFESDSLCVSEIL